MPVAASPPETVATVADLLRSLGDVPPERVWARPAPGSATEADVLDAHDRLGRLCELIDGTLVEKTMGFTESCLALLVGTFLNNFIMPRHLGVVAGADGTIRLFPGLVFIPDVSYVSWDRLPGRRLPEEPIPDLIPDLAVEVLSKSNTKREMARKLREYFRAGVRLVWLIDPEGRTARVYTAEDRVVTLDEAGILDGGDVLPGFALPLADLFGPIDGDAN